MLLKWDMILHEMLLKVHLIQMGFSINRLSVFFKQQLCAIYNMLSQISLGCVSQSSAKSIRIASCVFTEIKANELNPALFLIYYSL